jgi:hypothetical protein
MKEGMTNEFWTKSTLVDIKIKLKTLPPIWTKEGMTNEFWTKSLVTNNYIPINFLRHLSSN